MRIRLIGVVLYQLVLAAAVASAVSSLVIVPDLGRRLAQWKRVEMSFDSSKLSERERRLLDKLMAVSREIESIHWRQADPDGLALYKSLEHATDPVEQGVRRMLWIQGGRFDLLDDYRPFVGSDPHYAGGGLYPRGTTREELEVWVKAHPAEKAALWGDRTVIQRKGEGFVALPYHVAYREFLEPAARLLREAADLAAEPGFARYLRLRADALLSDDYFESDLAWLDLENPKFDLVCGAYETYGDGVLGVKTSYEASVLVRNEDESRKLDVFQKYVPDLQQALPLGPEDKPSLVGRRTPMEVMDTLFRSGDVRHGYQAIAENLPNDPRVQAQKGSKRIFFKNYMDGRLNYVILPVARLIMRSDHAARVSADGFLANALMHEVSHGLGPQYAHVNGKQVDIREAIGPAYSGLEEAKADVTGMFGVAWLVDHGVLPKERLQEYYDSYVAGIFRTVRFGTAEAHGKAQMMEFNVLAESGAIRRGHEGRYEVRHERLRDALAQLAHILLDFEARGDRAGVEAWFAKYAAMPAELETALEAAKDVPVDIDPEQAFPESVR